MKKEQEKLPEKKKKGNQGKFQKRFSCRSWNGSSRRAVGASVLSSCGGTTTETIRVTETKTVPTTVTTTRMVGEGEVVTVTAPGGGLLLRR